MPQALFDLGERPRPTRGGVTYATVLNGWNKLKNGRAALQAFALVRAEAPGAQLTMIGPGHEPGGPAEVWAREAGFGAGVRFLGPMAHAEVLEFLARSVDVVVHPSFEESFGMVLAEAGALGLPVIAGARSGAVPWTLDGGTAGLLVDVRAPRELARAMLSLAEDQERRRALGLRGRDNALRRFHNRVVTDAYQAAYARLREASA